METKIKEEVKDALENGKDYNSAEELFDDVLDMKHYCSNCESDFEGVGDGTCPECEGLFEVISPEEALKNIPELEIDGEALKNGFIATDLEEQRWWEERFDTRFTYEWWNGFGTTEDINKLGIDGIKHFIKQVEDEAREEERARIIRLIKEKGLHLGYANNILKLIEK